MSVFPTQYSVLKASALKDYLSEFYNVVFTDVKFLIHNVSDTYLLWTAENRFVFKIYRDAHRSKAEIMGEVELLRFLHNNGAAVSVPIQSSLGDFLIPFNAAEGIRSGVLFSYAEGEVKPVMTDKQLQAVGTEMAKLHLLSSKVQLRYPRREYSIETTLRRPLEVLKPAFDNLEDEYQYLKDTCDSVERELRKLDLDGFSHGYCQYDFLPKNFHFDSEDKLTFFDFDFAGPGYLINDIASFYIHFFLDVTYKKLTRDEAERAFGIFLDAYRKLKPVSRQEIESIRLFGFGFWMFYFQFHFEHFDDWSNFFFTPRFIRERVNLFKAWMEY